jgi:predicted RNA binding protein with dsRBD fold (UPF0201 family)
METDQNFVYRASEASQIRTSEPSLHKKLNTLKNYFDRENIADTGRIKALPHYPQTSAF